MPTRRLRSSVVLAVLALGALAGCPGGANAPAANKARSVVLYCATDREIAQEVLDRFEQEKGIHVDAKFDTEAAKAVGLVQAIRAEKAQPQCDVLWGGGSFFCTLLANEGCLAPVPQDLVAAEGTAPHDAKGRWLGFAASYRVLIVNTAMIESGSWPRSYRDLSDPRYKGHIGIANPLFGGMGAHVAALFSKLGEAEGRRWLESLKKNDVALCAGMADVRDRVALGELWFGITSTIDAHVAVDGGKPVVVVFPDQEPGGIGCLEGYGTVAMTAGAPHPEEAVELIRYVVSSKTERILAAGPAQSVGMLPGSEDVHPAWIPRGLHVMDVDWDQAVLAHPAARAATEEILLGR
jgi:iron(III) transport system substrate-binding protein